MSVDLRIISLSSSTHGQQQVTEALAAVREAFRVPSEDFTPQQDDDGWSVYVKNAMAKRNPDGRTDEQIMADIAGQDRLRRQDRADNGTMTSTVAAATYRRESELWREALVAATSDLARLAYAVVAETREDLARKWDGFAEEEAAKAAAMARRCGGEHAGRPCAKDMVVTLTDVEGDKAKACTEHAVEMVRNIPGLKIGWDTFTGNEHDRAALRITETYAAGPIEPGNR